MTTYGDKLQISNLKIPKIWVFTPSLKIEETN